MIKIAKNIYLDKNDIKETFIRSSGSGGQHVNKVSTKVQLRYNIFNFLKISNYFLIKIKEIAGSKLKKNGDLIINSSRYKSQIQNRKDAEKKLIYILKKTFQVEKQRKPMLPRKKDIEKRLKNKRIQSLKKKDRKNISIEKI